METARVPHPFDSHPFLDERMHNVKSVIPPSEFGAVVVAQGEPGWASRIDTAAAIETRLWTQYERRFAQAHEHDLAYRSVPTGDAEQAIVEKYFPARVFTLKDNEQFVVAFDGLGLKDEKLYFAWDEVANLKYDDAYLADILKVTTTSASTFGNKTHKVKLPGIKEQRDEFKAALGQYWHRHKVSHGKS